MSLQYRWEKFGNLIPELPRIFQMHYDEVVSDREHFAMDFKWNRHIDLENMGILRVLTARSEKTLAGYVFWLVNENLNFLQKNAITSLYFLDPLYRREEEGAFCGTKLFTESEPGLKKMGVDLMFVTSPLHQNVPAFDRLMKMSGYNPFQNVYSKFL